MPGVAGDPVLGRRYPVKEGNMAGQCDGRHHCLCGHGGRATSSEAINLRGACNRQSICAQTVDNDYIAEKVDHMRNGVERGESVLRAAIASEAFTPVVLQMIAVGEESGSLDEMMEEISGMYQSEVEYELKTLAQQIEPILIVLLGAMVLVLALGIFLPLWDLSKVAMKK